MSQRFGMVVDLNRCVGCQTCTVACKHANDTTPGVQWRRVLDVEMGTFPDVERLFLVVGCQHCAQPPCVPVCPTGATFRRDDGLVAMDYDLCIGCGYCAVACPYQARTIVHDQRWYFGVETAQERAVVRPERLGVAQKCTFCVEKIDEARESGQRPGVDLEVTPACAASCIAQAIEFGNLADPASGVSQRLVDNPSVRMHAELGAEPQIHYLYESPAVPGTHAGRGDDATSLLDGSTQPFWDLRAAANFTFGGAGAGLAASAYLAHLAQGLSAQALAAVYVVAATLMALGLFAVFLEIGRKRRFLYALRRPQTSWMTREMYAVALFYPLVTAAVLAPRPPLLALTALVALVFLYCQARILHAARGIPAWRAPLVPALVLASGLLEGIGGLALVAALTLPVAAADAVIVPGGVALAAATAALWNRYVAAAARNGIGAAAQSLLRRITPWLHGVGHVAPVALLAAAAAFDAPRVLLFLAGTAALAGGALWKVTVITRACQQQDFALPRVPRRGSGRRAAPRRLAAGVGS